jgi:predicted ATPase
MPVVILLENAQWADDDSLNVIEYLLEACYDLPILVVCLARPEFLEKRPLWNVENDPLSPYLKLPIPALSAIDSRHMVADILTNIRHVPFKMSDLVVYSAQGNPLHIEQIIHLLYEGAIIQEQEFGIHVNLGKLDEIEVPRTLPDIFSARIALLPYEEKEILKAASVIGALFWDVAIENLISPEIKMTPEVLQTALTMLEQKEFIVRKRSSMLAGMSQFSFVYDKLQDVVYSQIPHPIRKIYHGRIADWLVARMKTQRLSFYIPIISAHYERANQLEKAAQWSEKM